MVRAYFSPGWLLPMNSASRLGPTGWRGTSDSSPHLRLRSQRLTFDLSIKQKENGSNMIHPRIISGSRFGRFLARHARGYLDYYRNVENYDMARNGERWLLTRAAKIFQGRKICVFDVGANYGEWSRIAMDLLPQAHIYAFEMIPEFQEAVRSLEQGGRLTMLPFGLSDQQAEREVFRVGGGGKMIPNPFSKKKPEPVRALLTTADEVMREHALTNVEMVKIDTDGHEIAVLAGMAHTLATRPPSIIQFEYSRYTLLHRYYLKDAYDLLGSHGYKIGRLLPKGVAFAKYKWLDEDFRSSNFVAARGPDLIKDLRCRF